MQRKQPVCIQNSFIFPVRAGHTATLLERRHWVVAFHQFVWCAQLLGILAHGYRRVYTHRLLIDMCFSLQFAHKKQGSQVSDSKLKSVSLFPTSCYWLIHYQSLLPKRHSCKTVSKSCYSRFLPSFHIWLPLSCVLRPCWMSLGFVCVTASLL